MTVSRSGNGGPDSLVGRGLFIFDVLWLGPVLAPYQLSFVCAVSRLAQLRKLSIRNMANRTINAVAGNRDRFSELRQPLGSLVNLVGAGGSWRQSLPIWH